MDRTELIKNAVYSVDEREIKDKGGLYPSAVLVSYDCKPKQIQNAISCYAPDCKPEEIVILIDQTIWGSGKKGFLFTQDRLYADKSEFLDSPLGKRIIPLPLFFDDLREVCILDDAERYVTLRYKDGRRFDIYGGLYTYFLHSVLRSIVEALNPEEQGSLAPGVLEHEPGTLEHEPGVLEHEPGTLKHAPGILRHAPEKSSDREAREIIMRTEPQEQDGTSRREPAPADAAAGKGSPEERFAAQKVAAQLGYADAQFDLGLMYEYGKGTETDLTKALYWYEKAAEQGHAKGQSYTGSAYRRGAGVEKDYDKAFYWYEKAAGQGRMQAQYGLGLLYEAADSGRTDKSMALHWYEKAAEQGHKKAQSCCADMYYNGEGAAEDKAKALQWYERAAEQGFDRCQSNCGVMYYMGIGTKIDYGKALYWSEKAAEQGQVNAMYLCAAMYTNGEGTERDPVKGYCWMEKAAQAGHEDAMYYCGLACRDGNGVRADREKAVYWLDMAASKGKKEAGEAAEEIRLQMQEEAEGRTPSDDLLIAGEIEGRADGTAAEAEEEAAAAEETGNAGSQTSAGTAEGTEDSQISTGMPEGTEVGLEDPEELYRQALSRCGAESVEYPEETIEILRKCAMRDHIRGQELLGCLYYRGRGVPEDKTRGLFWLRQAERNGCCGWEASEILEMSETHMFLGEDSPQTEADREELCRARERYAAMELPESLYGYGCDIEPQDEEQAFLLYEKAAKQGHLQAQFKCGEFCREGRGAEANPRKALNWYRKAAKQGHAAAQYCCGLLYEKGEGTETDPEKALEWYRRASLQGHRAADEKSRWNEVYETEEGREFMASRRALVYSPGSFNLSLIKSCLGKTGITAVSTAQSRDEFLEKYRREKPHLLVLDREKKVEDLFQTAEEAAEACPRAKIILHCNQNLKLPARRLENRYRDRIVGTFLEPIEEKSLLMLTAKAVVGVKGVPKKKA